MKNLFLKIQLSLLFVLVFSLAEASTPKIKTYKSQRDFSAGEPSGVSINATGEVVLAPQVTEIFKSDSPFIWATVLDNKGNLYAAGGTKGQVFKIDKQKKSSLFFEVEEVQIFALAASNSHLYIASSPEGKVYKVALNDKSGKGTVFFEPEEIYIWSMVLDGKGNLFVATGEKGNIYKIDSSGKSSLFYESEEDHVRKLAFDNKGNLIAGTANKGLVLRIDSSGKAFVIYDSPLVEITDVYIDDKGNIYVAATGDTPLRATRPVVTEEAGQSDEDEMGEEEAIEMVLQPIVAGGGGGRAGKRIGELYRIDSEGTVRTFQTLKSERIYCISSLSNGQIVLGAGDKGLLYALNFVGEMTILTKFEETQVTHITRDQRGYCYIATSNAGNVYSLDKSVNKSGHLLSEAFDAGMQSSWGEISWETRDLATGKIVLQSRSGNSEKPDKTWSKWSAEYETGDGTAITSPKARYIQLKAIVSSNDEKKSPGLKELSFSYLHKNVAPDIRKIYIHNPGTYYQEATENGKSNSNYSGSNGQGDYQAPSAGRKSHKQGYRSISWISSDDNGDKQSYSVFFKGIEEKKWRILVEDFHGIAFSWDSELMPDGEYLLKLEARDDGSNPPAMVLKTDKVSEPFTIDNTGPVVSDLVVKSTANETLISFTARDKFSNVSSVEYSLNAEDWQLTYPVDGICDSKLEKFEIRIPGSTKGLTSVVIKAEDSVKNRGFGKNSKTL